jgi:SAM-dependent methyltransferase
LTGDTEANEHERHNRTFWDADADAYQALHAEQLARGKVWGAWAIPEAELDVLGDVAGLDVLEYGCGGAQWAAALAREGARVVALDQSSSQLRHASVNTRKTDVRLVCASGEAVPLADGSFDLVFCDHGAMSFCDPRRSVPEVARLLRPGGRLVFNKATMLLYLTWDATKQRQTKKLHASAFEHEQWAFDGGTVDFQLPYGAWIRCFRDAGLAVVDLIELRAPEHGETTYDEFVPHDWARRWPAEEIWVVRKGRSAFGARS